MDNGGEIDIGLLPATDIIAVINPIFYNREDMTNVRLSFMARDG